MVRSIFQLGSPILRTRAREIELEELSSDAILTLATDLKDTLSDAGGVGMAAPQVGESVRLILAGSFPSPRAPERPRAPMLMLANPRVVWASNETAHDWEGCLSFLQYRVRLQRPVSIRVAYMTMDGSFAELDASGFYARVLQHEIDHVDGILTLDRAAAPEDIEDISTPPAR